MDSKKNNTHCNLQETFLNYIRKNKVPTTIFLVNGIKLQGIVSWFDNFCILIRRDNYAQMLYKHSIATIAPNKPISLMEQEEKSHTTTEQDEKYGEEKNRS